MAVQKKSLRIGWLLNTEERWNFHKIDKDILWDMLRKKKIDFKALYTLLKVDNTWIEIRTSDKIPINYPFYKFMWDHYRMVYRKFNPPLHYRLAVPKLGIILLVLFKDDSAYTERIGGITQYIMEHPEDWPQDKEARILALHDLKQWWWDEDWRMREKENLAFVFDWIIEHYETEPFIQKTIDYIIDTIIANAHKWNDAGGYFRPERWYPRGKGPINYLVHARTS